MTPQPIFITGIGTDAGKTITAAIIVEALEADYWKPVQAGYENGTDALQVKNLITNTRSVIHPEAYKLSLAASPHIAARKDNVKIDLDLIVKKYEQLATPARHTGGRNGKPETRNYKLIIEGAGGLLVPLNENEFVIDLIQKLSAKVILVSRNYLGSINHSLLTAAACKQKKLNVAGWIFNDQYMNYENEIVQWSGYKKIASIPFSKDITRSFIKQQADKNKNILAASLQ
ncbi:MAG TPA: dethiobiotin synthase [Chitinophagaceae bacterium]|jgi:dethiobiotin synthetase